MKEAEKLAGICGIYCGTCPSYLASRENDMEQTAKIARDFNLPVTEIRCDGCLSDHPIAHCAACRHGFRTCAREKEVTWCFECSAFPCERLDNFRNVHIVDGISHHEHIVDQLRCMKQHGVEAWVKEQEKAGKCPQCGKRLYWFTRACPSCKTSIKKV